MTYTEDIKNAASLCLPWEQLKDKNILVTGATGLIGSTLVEVLMSHPKQDYHVYASGRNENKVKTLFSEYAESKYFHFINHDVCKVLNSSITFHIIIAAAGVASPQLYATDPVSVMKSNFNGVDNLLMYGVAHNVEKFLYVSSGEIYGEGDGRVFDENYSGYVNCATLRACYPSAKRATESLCIAYSKQYGIDVRIARPCHVYGPNFGNTDQRVYAQFIRNVLRGEDIVMKSTGEQFRSWCYAVDCASALLHILLKGESGNAYNIADDNQNITIKELAEMIARIGGKKVVIDLPTDIEKRGFNVVQKSIFSIDKIKSLGWTIYGSFEDKIKATIDKCKL